MSWLESITKAMKMNLDILWTSVAGEWLVLLQFMGHKESDMT